MCRMWGICNVVNVKKKIQMLRGHTLRLGIWRSCLYFSLCVYYMKISFSICFPASVCNPIPPLMTPAQFTGGPLAQPTASQTTPTQVLPQFRAPPPSKFSEEGFGWTEPATVEAWRPVHQKHQSEKIIQRPPDHRYTNTSAHPVTLVVCL